MGSVSFGKGQFGKHYRKFTDIGEWPVPPKPATDLTSKYSPSVLPKDKSATAGPFFVMGIKASDLEWRVYRTLHKLGWTDSNIHFQTPILGGRNPGGQVLDFVCYGFGTVYVIFVNGEYWHSRGVRADITRMNENKVRYAMPSANVVSLFTSDLMTDEIAKSNLTRLVGRGA